MPTYAYRWADGTVSVCGARNRNEAMGLFDRFAGVSRKLIIRLHSPLLFTVKADIDRWWVLDEDEPLGVEISSELENECYPNYEKALADLDPETGRYKKKNRAKLKKALLRDRASAEKRLEDEFPTMDLIAMFPKGLPGQEN